MASRSASWAVRYFPTEKVLRIISVKGGHNVHEPMSTRTDLHGWYDDDQDAMWADLRKSLGVKFSEAEIRLPAGLFDNTIHRAMHAALNQGVPINANGQAGPPPPPAKPRDTSPFLPSNSIAPPA